MNSIISFVDSDYVFNNYQYFSKVTTCLDLRPTENQQKYKLMNTFKLDRTALLKNEKELNIENISNCMQTDDSKLFEKRKRLFIYLFLFEKCEFSKKIKFIIDKLGKKNELCHFLKPDQCKVDKELFLKEINEEFPNGAGADDEELVNLEIGLKIYNLLQKEKIQELYIICDSAEFFFNKYPCMNDNIPLYSGILHSIMFPNNIYHDRIYVGGYLEFSNDIIVKTLKFTHIINCTKDIPNYFENQGITYLTVYVDDYEDCKITEFFEPVYNFIEKALKDEKSVIGIHCHIGKSRSPSFAIIYLMKKFSLDYETAFDYVKNKRQNTFPNIGFEDEMLMFAKNKFVFQQDKVFLVKDG